MHHKTEDLSALPVIHTLPKDWHDPVATAGGAELQVNLALVFKNRAITSHLSWKIPKSFYKVGEVDTLEVPVKDHTELSMKTTSPLPRQTPPNTMESFGHRDLTGALIVGFLGIIFSLSVYFEKWRFWSFILVLYCKSSDCSRISKTELEQWEISPWRSTSHYYFTGGREVSYCVFNLFLKCQKSMY